MMNRLFRILPVIALSLLLAGCSGSRVGELIEKVTTPFTNPVTPNNIYQVKLTFDLAVKSGNKWASYCWSKTYRALMIDSVGRYICADRRSMRRALIAAADEADAKIKKAARFVRDNPTINPLDLIRDAWAAVMHYKNLVTPIAP